MLRFARCPHTLQVLGLCVRRRCAQGLLAEPEAEHLRAWELPGEGLTALTIDRIRELFPTLDGELSKQGVIGGVGICGRAVMCLVFRARRATEYVNAIFKPTQGIRAAAEAVAARLSVPDDRLNDAVRAFVHADPPREDVLNLPNLRIWAPPAEYMLAMKCISARFDSSDLDDTKFLIE